MLPSMAFRTLELTLISAKDVKDVNVFSKMDVYAVATIAGDHRTLQRTPIDRNCGKNPSWNAILRFSVPADHAAASHLIITVLLRSERVLGDRDIGEVHIPLKDLLDGQADGSKFVSYQVRKPSGKAKGVLNISYNFFDLPAAATAPPLGINAYPPPAGKGTKGDEPVMAYPAAGASASAYPPPGGYPAYPPAGYGYSAPPPAGYGYGYGAQPAVYGYGYGAPPPGYGYGGAPPRNNRNNFGMGLGAGLLGGALGGLLIGDMFSDASAYDAGYDAGFDDGGFGF